MDGPNVFEVNTPLAKKAHAFAKRVHKGQQRWLGQPYITHPEAVAQSTILNFNMYCNIKGRKSDPRELDELMAVALLHDTIEDGENKAQKQLREKFPEKIVAAVVRLTRKGTDTYAEYIAKLIEDVTLRHIVIPVKLADLDHNTSDLKKGSLHDKYALAIMFLERVLGDY